MSKVQIGKERIFNNEFVTRGVEGVTLWEIFPVVNNELICVVFEEANSLWRQGIWLKTDRGLEINNELCPSAVLWFDTAPRQVLCRCLTYDGCLSVYNVWDEGEGRRSQGWSSGMLVEELPNGRRYRCNDVGFDTRFDKLVVRVERRPRVH
jgi:hypothetical protein